VKVLSSAIFQSVRAAIVAVLVFGILLPSLVQALPRPALTPEQELLQDIATTICSETINGNRDSRDHDNRACKHCILCSVSSFAVARLDSNQSSAASLYNLSPDSLSASWSVPRLHPLSRETGPPRGPPTLS
jgi:hypothetical protein